VGCRNTSRHRKVSNGKNKAHRVAVGLI
jgi:hypothetical protein